MKAAVISRSAQRANCRVIRRPDRSAIALPGSANKSASAGKMNYERLWEDDSPESNTGVFEQSSGRVPGLSPRSHI
jgi:hypothetical protein